MSQAWAICSTPAKFYVICVVPINHDQAVLLSYAGIWSKIIIRKGALSIISNNCIYLSAWLQSHEVITLYLGYEYGQI